MDRNKFEEELKEYMNSGDPKKRNQFMAVVIANAAQMVQDTEGDVQIFAGGIAFAFKLMQEMDFISGLDIRERSLHKQATINLVAKIYEIYLDWKRTFAATELLNPFHKEKTKAIKLLIEQARFKHEREVRNERKDQM